jgi:hypothetical protein
VKVSRGASGRRARGENGMFAANGGRPPPANTVCRAVTTIGMRQAAVKDSRRRHVGAGVQVRGHCRSLYLPPPSCAHSGIGMCLPARIQ